MAEAMTEHAVDVSGETKHWNCMDKNKDFDKNGYFVVKDLWDPEELYHPVPELRGQLNYYDKDPTHFNHIPLEQQVEGSLHVIGIHSIERFIVECVRN